MNKKISSLLQYIFFLGLGIFLVWWSIGKIEHHDWLEMKASMKGANYWLLVPVTVALLVSHFSRAIRWRILMEPMGYKPNITNTYLAVLIGYLANLAVPRLGEVLKCTLLARYEKIPADKLIGTIVAERAFDLICLVLIFMITIFSQIDTIGQFAGNMVRKIMQGDSGETNYTKLIIVGFILLILVYAGWYILKKFSHNKFIHKIKELAKGIWEGLTSVRNVRKKGWFFFHSAFIWFLYLAAIKLGFYAMEATSIFGWLPSFSVLSLGSVGMIVTQGGIGAYPILVQETMMLYGLGENIGKAFGWILWLAQFFLVLFAGGLSMLLLPVVNRKKAISPITKADSTTPNFS
ncbi:lysylphosphatidylglycerol synthase transmembrane domain-containing protein [Flavihumibacter profundi]|jgi:glycosyltransferase 2 family protein|uniref:lysylphosphatidylglycerol synthase transmembrane domain-containing protein n=1 Tax=Flavihumibacter profundi TaxID=2716883 RepID=UPI001CC70841|nr:lysylphosphatidylglycerol synthase transmembrane domain-containing protein [Flavihumibacter profundi]MBZ5855893.1 flippase-like domain-containing protein [Flavihumibacter profundi]